MSPSNLILYRRSTTTTATSNNTLNNNTNSTNPNNNTSAPINPFQPTDPDSLSIGAKAGIVLAVLVVIALILLGILYFLRRVRKAREGSDMVYGAVNRDGSGDEVDRVQGSELVKVGSGSTGVGREMTRYVEKERITDKAIEAGRGS